MFAAPAIGFMMDAIRKIVSRRIGSLPPTVFVPMSVTAPVSRLRGESRLAAKF